MAFVIEYIRTMVSGLEAPQVSRKTTLPFRAMRPEAPFSRPVVMCSFITMLIRLRRSLEKPACSGAAVGKLAPTTNDATKQKTKRTRMSANLSQRQAPHVRQTTKQWAAELGPAVKPCVYCVQRSEAQATGGSSVRSDLGSPPLFRRCLPLSSRQTVWSRPSD